MSENSSSQAITFVVLIAFFAVLIGSGWFSYGDDDPGSPDDTLTASGAAPNANPDATPNTGPSQADMARMAAARMGGGSGYEGWRQVIVPPVPNGVDVFSSGNCDTYRTPFGAINLHVQEVDPENYGVWYTSMEDPDGKRHFASLRFCRRISFRSNPQIDSILESLNSMPERVPLISGAQEIDGIQEDCGIEFRDMKLLTTADGGTELVGQLKSRQKVRREFCNFHFSLIDKADPTAEPISGYFQVSGLLPDGVEEFRIPLSESQDSAAVEIQQPAVKIWLHFTASQALGRPMQTAPAPSPNTASDAVGVPGGQLDGNQ